MATYYTIIPQEGVPQNFQVVLGGVLYNMTLMYRDCEDLGGWVLDIADSGGNALVNGIPLVTGIDLLESYPDMDFGGSLVVSTQSDPDAVPTFDNLGGDGQLYWVTTP